MNFMRAAALMEPVAHSAALLTVCEVARELRCSNAHVHHLIAGSVSGAQPLTALWLGRRRLVRRDTLTAWIKANEHTAA